ncbi:Rap/ran-GAP-like protein [Elsinoe fawcettii]|nr:Rap/ran-GAP-like protein [Elsinoe fawcettii]
MESHEVVAVFEVATRLKSSEEADLVAIGCNLVRILFTSQKVPQSLRVDFVKSMRDQSSSVQVANQPACLAAATDDGRNIDGMERTILTQTCDVTRNCLQLCTQAEEKDSGFSDSDRAKFQEAFEKSLSLLRSTVQFGPSVSGANHAYVITETRHMIEQITLTSSLLKLLDVLDAFITRGELPDGSLVPVIMCLCALYAKSSQREQVLGKAKQTLEWLFSTHVKDELLETLVIILEDACRPGQYDASLANGALQLLTVILSDDMLYEDAEIDIDAILTVLRYKQYAQHYILLSNAASLLTISIKKPSLQEALLGEPDWATLTGALLNTYKAVRQAGDNVSRIISGTFDDALITLARMKRISIRQKYQLDILFLELGQFLPEQLSEDLLRTYVRSPHPGDAHRETKIILSNFVASEAVKPHLRLLAASEVRKIIVDVHQTEPTVAKDCIKLLLDILLRSNMETSLQDHLVTTVVDYLTYMDYEDDDLFDITVERFCEAARQVKYSDSKHDNQIKRPKTAKPIATGLGLLFMRNVNASARRVQNLMVNFIDLLRGKDIDPAASVMLLRVLVRLRSDINHRIFLAVSPEGEGLAATLSKATKQAHDLSRRPSKSSAFSDSGPVWMYGQVRGLPEDPEPTVSQVLSSKTSNTDNVTALDLKTWLRYATSIVAKKDGDWEVFSYTIVHLGAQLTNQTLFVDAVPELRELRALLCSQLKDDSVYKPDESTGIKSGDVAACLYHVLTMLIGYHPQFKRHETEDMISAFINGFGAWGSRTTVACIHALTLCCYELPKSLERDLVRILSGMSTSITKPGAAMHVLEFLAGLSRLTDLSRIFRGEEIKMVFGVCFSYIDNVRNDRFDDQQRARVGSLSRSTERQHDLVDPTDELPEYVFALAYFVITFWFLALKQSDREDYFDWVQSRLLKEIDGKREEQALVTLDFAWRITKRITGSVSLTPPSAFPPAAALASQYSLMTLHESAGPTSQVQIIDRRASGTDEWSVEVSSGNAEEVLRSQVLERASNPFPDAMDPIALDYTDRAGGAISLFDRVSPVDFFKAGILYVGEDQSSESAILGNSRGSPDYNMMLHSLGETLLLEGCPFNTCGLDTSEGKVDGDRTIWSRDDVTALIFHVTTLMPNHIHDLDRTTKKRHIGNDYVNVIFNNSGVPWKFGNIPSAFDYVYIVVSPEARSTFIETRTVQNKDKDWFQKSWFKVQVLTKEGFPNVGSASETKVVSGKALGLYVKNLVLNACIFAEVWAEKEGGGGVGSWRSRLGQLRNIRERFGKKEGEETDGAGKDKGKDATKGKGKEGKK